LRALDSGFAPVAPMREMRSAPAADRAGRGVPPADPIRAEARKSQKSLDFEGSIRQNQELSEYALPPRHFRSKITARPNVSPIPACCAHQPTARPQRQHASGATRGGSPEISKKTLVTGPRRAVSDTNVRSHTGGSRNF